MLTLQHPPLIENWYRLHADWLGGRLARKLDCHGQAADFVHDTFERVLKSPPRDIAEPRAYLATIAHGLLVNHWRRLELERAYLAALHARGEALATDQEARLAALQELETLARLLDGLPARARQIFLLARLDGLPYAEIAQALQLSLNIVQKDMLKAVQHCYRLQYGQF